MQLAMSSVRIIHVRHLFLPMDTQHIQWPCRFFILEVYELCGHKLRDECCLNDPEYPGIFSWFCREVTRSSERCPDTLQCRG